MASDINFVKFVVDQIDKSCDVSYRMMFGEYALYSNAKVVALICDDQLFVKPTDAGRKFIGDVVEAPPYPGAKLSFLIDDMLEDPERLSELIRLTENELPMPKPRKKSKKRKRRKPDKAEEGRPMNKLATCICLLTAMLTINDGVAASMKSPAPGAIGTVERLSGPTDCDDQACYEISVACPDVAAAARARVKVASPRGTNDGGTTVFMTGGAGTDMYEDYSSRTPDLLQAVRDDGFRTVQLQWLDGWLFASEGERAGHVRLACRPATAMRWIHETMATKSADKPFCATGHSGGAAQLSYMLTHYGLEDIFDGAVPTGGPPMGRMDLSCDRDNPANASLAYPVWATNIIDAGFGYLPEGEINDFASFVDEGSGPCARGDEQFFADLRDASIASDQGDYIYPDTMIYFVFEGIDDTKAVAQGELFVEALKSSGSPMLKTSTVPGVSHYGPNGLLNTEAGIEQVHDSLREACRIRE